MIHSNDFPFFFSVVLIFLFFLDHLLVVLINPAILTSSPTSEDSIKIIDQSAGRSLAIFALVLVVIQFTLDGGTPLTYYETLTLAVLIMAAGFLMITFVLELVADWKIFLFRVQLNSLRYSGLLLFLGLFLLLKSKDVPNILPNIFGVFVVLSWIIWIIHEIHYIFKTQKKEWDAKNIPRCEWVKTIFDES